MDKKTIIIAGLLLLIFIIGCEFAVEDLMVAIKEKKEAETKGTIALCPDDKPYRIGGFFGGVCVDEASMNDYIDLKIKGTIAEDEKKFILTAKGLMLGKKKSCPKSTPYYVSSYLFWGKCVTSQEFKAYLETDIKAWSDKEEAAGRTRFLADVEGCDKDEIYDAHTDSCVDIGYCNDLTGTFYNKKIGVCDCEEGYAMTRTGCIRESQKECEYDNECTQTPRCSGNTLIRYVCNPQMFKCEPQEVDCGAGFDCSEGRCVKK
ncbi:MAG: hypothetical protein U9R08_00240 [Nanoarchaeota archaeon]|nr:hypothetical protein [Nanoarchaeota archaeon]